MRTYDICYSHQDTAHTSSGGNGAPRLTIVTAGNAKYGRCLWQFFRSAMRCRIDGRARFIAYDIGLGAWRRKLAAAFPWVVFRDFRFSDKPPHVAVERGTYAWKPLIIADALEKTNGVLLWLDSATLFKTGEIGDILDIIRRNGTYTNTCQSTLAEHCHPNSLNALGAAPFIHRMPERTAAVIGLDAQNRNVCALVDAWRRHALIEEHIWPKGAVLASHKPEQALLSILLYQAQAAGVLRLNDGDTDVSSPSPVRWITTRNKVPAGVPLWADPFARAWYWAYKCGDQTWLKYLRWKNSWPQGAGGSFRHSPKSEIY